MPAFCIDMTSGKFLTVLLLLYPTLLFMQLGSLHSVPGCSKICRDADVFRTSVGGALGEGESRRLVSQRPQYCASKSPELLVTASFSVLKEKIRKKLHYP